MPPEPVPGSAGDWLARARGDLALAKVPLPEDAFLEDLCFHAHQATEKALKAVYRERGWPFRYVHVIEELLTGLRDRGIAVPPEVEEAVILTEYATASRYPGRQEPVTQGEYAAAVGIAERVVAWAASMLADVDH